MEPDSEAFRTRAMAMIKEKYGSDTEMMSILGDVAEYE
jgi:hypothetical protein